MNNAGEQLILHRRSLGVIDDVAEGKFESAGRDDEGDGGLEWRIDAAIVDADRFPGRLRFDEVFSHGFAGDSREHFADKLAIAGGCEEEFYLIPNELKSLRVIEDGAFQDHAVGDAHDAPVVQVFADPVSRFNQSGAEKADVDDVAMRVADLYAIAYGVQLGKADGKCAGNAGHDVLKSHGHTGASDTEGETEAAEAVFEENREEQEDAEKPEKTTNLRTL